MSSYLQRSFSCNELMLFCCRISSNSMVSSDGDSKSLKLRIRFCKASLECGEARSACGMRSILVITSLSNIGGSMVNIEASVVLAPMFISICSMESNLIFAILEYDLHHFAYATGNQLPRLLFTLNVL